MSSVPYSRYLFGTVPWYSVLIVIGAVFAILIASREERRAGLPKDTIIDLALWILPGGIIGARIYYVIFSWEQFQNNLLSVFKIWEGGIAIYGGIIAGLIILILFSRKRHLPFLQLCDIIVPGLVLAQSIGRWGNWFNIEAYGWPVSQISLCFFPLAVQIPADGYRWHLATFFYESVWDFLVFIFLMISRRKLLRHQGDLFFFYVFLYAAGRFVIEEMRMDSLLASSSVRVSQLLSAILCVSVLIRYLVILKKNGLLSRLIRFTVVPVIFLCTLFFMLYSLSGSLLSFCSSLTIILILSFNALIMIICMFFIYHPLSVREVYHAND